MMRITRVFEGLPHVRPLTRGGKTEYQYRRDINPKPLRPIAKELFGQEAVVRSIKTLADYHAAGLEFAEKIARCEQYIRDSDDIRLTYQGSARRMVYHGPIQGRFASTAILAARGFGAESLFLAGRPKTQQPGRTPYSTEQAIRAWVADRPRLTKGPARRNKQTKMRHFYAWLAGHGRCVAFIDLPAGFVPKAKAGVVDGRIADLSHDDLTQITSAELQGYKEHLINAHGNNYAIDHLSDIKALLAVAANNGKFGPGASSPGDDVKLPGKRQKGTRDQFSDAEVRAILDALPGTPPYVEWPVRVMTYLGLITEEVADATTHDVERVGGMIVLHVRDTNRKLGNGETNELKEQQRARSLPLHPDIAEGFWAYVEAIRRSHGEGPLFPQVATDRDGMRRGRIGRAVRDFIKGLGIAATPYSFRHRFLSALKTLTQDTDIRRYCGGHKPRDVHAGTYLHYAPGELKPLLDQIRPAGLPHQM